MRFKAPSTFSSSQSESTSVSERVARKSRERKHKERQKEKEKRIREERAETRHAGSTRDEYPATRQERVQHAAAYTHGGRKAPSTSPSAGLDDASESPIKRGIKIIHDTFVSAFGYGPEDTPGCFDTPSRRRWPGAFPGMSIDSDTEGPSSPSPSVPADLGPDEDDVMGDVEGGKEAEDTEMSEEPGMTSDTTSSPSSAGSHNGSGSFSNPGKNIDYFSADVSTDDFMEWLRTCSSDCPGSHYYTDPDSGCYVYHHCPNERQSRAEVDEHERKIEEFQRKVDEEFSKIERKIFDRSRPSSFDVVSFRKSWKERREARLKRSVPPDYKSPFRPFAPDEFTEYPSRKRYFPDVPWSPEEREKRRKLTATLEAHAREKERKKREESERTNKEWEKECNRIMERRREYERFRAEWLRDMATVAGEERREKERAEAEARAREEAEAEARAQAEAEAKRKARAEEAECLRRERERLSSKPSRPLGHASRTRSTPNRQRPSRYKRSTRTGHAQSATSHAKPVSSNPSAGSPSSANPTAQRKSSFVAHYKQYVSNWAAIASMKDTDSLSFQSIPWPLIRQPHGPEAVTPVRVKEFMKRCYAKGLIPSARGLSPFAGAMIMTTEQKRAVAKVELKNWHPDKFTIRVLARVWDEGEREVIRKAADIVQKTLTEFMVEQDERLGL